MKWENNLRINWTILWLCEHGKIQQQIKKYWLTLKVVDSKVGMRRGPDCKPECSHQSHSPLPLPLPVPSPYGFEYINASEENDFFFIEFGVLMSVWNKYIYSNSCFRWCLILVIMTVILTLQWLFIIVSLVGLIKHGSLMNHTSELSVFEGLYE